MSILSPRIRVAVLRGGPSSEYEASLATGAHVLTHLRSLEEVYDPLDVFISRSGEWHLHGLVHEPHRALRHVDVVWNALHGEYGEDGQVQRVLEKLQIPYTGSSAFGSALAMNKEMARRAFEQFSIPVPRHELIAIGDLSDDLLIGIFRNYLHPVVVKPSRNSGNLGVTLAYSFEDLNNAVAEAFKYSSRIIIEEHIRGREVKCFVVDKARGEEVYALIPVGELGAEERKLVESVAKSAHGALGMKHYSAHDLIVTSKGRVYILETNSLPRLGEESHLHTSLQNTGWQTSDFVDHIIKLALESR